MDTESETVPEVVNPSVVAWDQIIAELHVEIEVSRSFFVKSHYRDLLRFATTERASALARGEARAARFPS